MSSTVSGLCIVITIFGASSAPSQTPLSKPVVAKLNVPIDTSKPMVVNQLFFAQIITSQDDKLPAGSQLAVQIVGGSLHAAAVRTSVGILHLSSPPATASQGVVSGSSISVSAGEYICFNVPGTCSPSRNPGFAANTMQSTAFTSPQYPFSIEGIGLQMSLDQVRAAAKTAGSVKGLEKQGPTTYNFNTRDLSFQIELTPSGKVRQYNVSDRNPRHIKESETSGPLHEKLVKAFGAQSTWGNAVIYDIGESGTAYAVVTDQSAP